MEQDEGSMAVLLAGLQHRACPDCASLGREHEDMGIDRG